MKVIDRGRDRSHEDIEIVTQRFKNIVTEGHGTADRTALHLADI